MGFGDPSAMRAGLRATKQARASVAGTITLDSYTRIGEHAAALRALRQGRDLNGYPIVAHDLATTGAVLDGLVDPTFPVQVRHGCAQPYEIFTALCELGLRATEGGPVSYCLPYGRVPLRDVGWTQRCCGGSWPGWRRTTWCPRRSWCVTSCR
jgi:methylaspartate mutase epsilon subunit